MVGIVSGESDKEAGKPANWEYEVDDGMYHPERSESDGQGAADGNVKYDQFFTMSPDKSKAYWDSVNSGVTEAARNAPLLQQSRDYGDEHAQARDQQQALKQKQAQARRQQEQVMMQQQNELNRARAQQQARSQQQSQVRYQQQPQARVQQQAQEQVQQGAIDPRTGEYFAPTGDGGYFGTKNGHILAPAGPDQVVDTKSGKVIQKY